MKEVAIRTNDGRIVLYKLGMKNRTVDAHYVTDARDLTSKRATEFEEISVDLPAHALPNLLENLPRG